MNWKQTAEGKKNPQMHIWQWTIIQMGKERLNSTGIILINVLENVLENCKLK